MESSRGVRAAPVIALRSGWRSAAWPKLGGITALALGLRLWRLDQNGYGTEYYSAGVRSMLDSPHNLLYNSFDPAGFVSLDNLARDARLLAFIRCATTARRPST